MKKETLEVLRKRLHDYVQKNNLRESEQRWLIGEIILKSEKHLTAQEVAKLVQRKYPKIGVATVYRNLKVLVEAQILKESLISPTGTALYEPYEKEHHDHVVCVDCGHIFEFQNVKIEKLQEQVLEKIDFQHVRHRHVLYAKCGYR